MLLTKPSNFKQNDSCAEFFDANFERMLLTKDANFKQNQSCAECFYVNFKQNHICAECFAQVLSKTANRRSLDIIDHTNQFRYIYSFAPFFAQTLGQTVKIFCQVVVFFTFLTKDAIFY